MPTASSTALSGTPVHCAMAVQPSSQVCRVICVRGENCFRSASENARGRATLPSTERRQSANAPACMRRYASPSSFFILTPGSVVPVAGNEVTSLAAYSRTSD